MNNPKTAPTAPNSTPSGPRRTRPLNGRRKLSTPTSASAPTKEMPLNRPKISSAHEPTDIGDHHLNIRPPLLEATSMCQKRSGAPAAAGRASRHPGPSSGRKGGRRQERRGEGEEAGGEGSAGGGRSIS